MTQFQYDLILGISAFTLFLAFIGVLVMPEARDFYRDVKAWWRTTRHNKSKST